MFPFIPEETIHFIIAFIAASMVFLPDLDNIESDDDRETVCQVLIAVVMKLLSIYDDPKDKTTQDEPVEGKTAEEERADDETTQDEPVEGKTAEEERADDETRKPYPPNNFWRRTNLGLLFKAFPAIMKPLVDFLRSTGSGSDDEHFLHVLLPLIYIIAYIDGDGSWCGDGNSITCE